MSHPFLLWLVCSPVLSSTCHTGYYTIYYLGTIPYICSGSYYSGGTQASEVSWYFPGVVTPVVYAESALWHLLQDQHLPDLVPGHLLVRGDSVLELVLLHKVCWRWLPCLSRTGGRGWLYSDTPLHHPHPPHHASLQDHGDAQHQQQHRGGGGEEEVPSSTSGWSRLALRVIKEINVVAVLAF